MSRLIVKNLPTKISQEKLHETFSGKGYVTDVQLKYTKEGKFRHFAFVGYQKEEDAERALKYFNNTFIGASKIQVEKCADIGDKNKPRAWSKYNPESSAFSKKSKEIEEKEEVKEKKDKSEKSDKKKKKKLKQREVDTLLEKYKNDSKFQEFLRVHKRNAVEAWTNDSILEVGKAYETENNNVDKEKAESSDDESDSGENQDVKKEETSEDEEESKDKVANKGTISDLDYLKSLTSGVKTETDTKQKPKKQPKEPKNEVYFTIKINGLHMKAKKKDVKDFIKPLKAKSIRVPRNASGFAYVGFATEKEMKQALNKNKSFMKGKQLLITKYEKDNSNQQNSKWKEQEESMNSVESISESGRLFIRNLPYTITDDDLENLFKKYGPLSEVNLPIDRLTRKVKGFAFVTYMMPENAVTAFNALDGTTFQGRLIHIIPGKSKDSAEELAEQEGLSFKQKKTMKDKANSGSSHNWNTLFLGTSAVADVMSDTYEVSKQDILIGDGKQSAAVRLALGETQIVTETRNFLEENGVSLDAFNRPATARSKTVILIKNLPSRTPVEEIRDLFAKHGELARVVLPPRGLTALVEFYESSEAKKAFRSLAYTKFHNTPLYLEWAPEGAFNKAAERNEEDVKEEEETQEEVDENEEPEDNTTLFVKNLNFATTESKLREHFTNIGKIHSVSVAMKKDSKGGNPLSMGFGFVQFKKAKSADKALKTMQHKRLDDHCLELKRSNRAESAGDVKTSRKVTNDVGKESTKILVRNVPFEAKQKEIEDIFKTFGELKFVRLPKKVGGTGTHRGFAFVDFHTKADAKKAFENLCHSTHLYERRLVLEWAAQEETIDDLRKKTAAHFDEGGPAKKLKKTAFVESVMASKKPDD